jgi:hypothetical protein
MEPPSLSIVSFEKQSGWTVGDRPIANPLVVLREDFADCAVLYNPETNDAVGLNAVGVAVWKRIDGQRDLAQLVAAVGDVFADIPETVRAGRGRLHRVRAHNGIVRGRTTRREPWQRGMSRRRVEAERARE